jgi:hypothetical protein
MSRGVREYSMLEGVCAKLPSLKKDCLWELEQGSPYTVQHTHMVPRICIVRSAQAAVTSVYTARAYTAALNGHIRRPSGWHHVLNSYALLILCECPGSRLVSRPST